MPLDLFIGPPGDLLSLKACAFADPSVSRSVLMHMLPTERGVGEAFNTTYGLIRFQTTDAGTVAAAGLSGVRNVRWRIGNRYPSATELVGPDKVTRFLASGKLSPCLYDCHGGVVCCRLSS